MYKKVIFIFILAPLYIHAEELTQNTTFKCNRVFESRKSELVELLDNINDKKQILESINDATKSVLDRKAKSLNKRKKSLDKKEKILNIKIARLNETVKRNAAILKEIKSILLTKITKAYTKMGAGKAAGILEQMEDGEASSILFLLQPKIMSNILSKMRPQKASSITLLIKQGPPFKKDIRSFAIKKPTAIEKAIKEDFK